MSDTYFLDLKFLASGHADEDELEAKLEEILEHLCDLEGAIDPDLTATLATAEVMFSLGIEAKDNLTALRDAMVLVRTAMHACGAGTPEESWGAMFQEIEQNIRRADATELVDA